MALFDDVKKESKIEVIYDDYAKSMLSAKILISDDANVLLQCVQTDDFDSEGDPIVRKDLKMVVTDINGSTTATLYKEDVKNLIHIAQKIYGSLTD